MTWMCVLSIAPIHSSKSKNEGHPEFWRIGESLSWRWPKYKRSINPTKGASEMFDPRGLQIEAIPSNSSGNFRMSGNTDEEKATQRDHWLRSGYEYEVESRMVLRAVKLPAVKSMSVVRMEKSSMQIDCD
ncbi:hypothetical protein BDR07DRAFT_1377084 [Suillus spraguei]|nr:hypothetical protein BDR07DRAFT_1377084 [Suillus spraguei]